jgi:hypothetical protein
LESEETPVEARNSLLQKGYTEEDIKRLEELRSSMIEAKEYSEMKKKYDPVYDSNFNKYSPSEEMGENKLGETFDPNIVSP